MSLPTTYTVAQVASAFQVAEWTVRELVKSGKVKPMRLSAGPRSPMRFTDDDVQDLEKALRSANPLADARSTTGSRRRRTAS